MKIEISTIQEEASNQQIFDLKEWIQDERIKGVKVSTSNLPTSEGKMGVDPDTIVAILSSVAAGFELFSSIINWMKLKKEDNKVKIKFDGKEIEISVSALSDEKETLKTIMQLLESSSPKK